MRKAHHIIFLGGCIGAGCSFGPIPHPHEISRCMQKATHRFASMRCIKVGVPTHEGSTMCSACVRLGAGCVECRWVCLRV